MPSVTVAGASNQTVTLKFDSNANAILARQLAAAITGGVQGHPQTILPVAQGNGPPTNLGGKSGEFIVTEDRSATVLPHGYVAVVDVAKGATITGSGDQNESVLISKGDATFIAPGGSGTVVGGGGSESIYIKPNVAGDWSIYTGNGDDTIQAAGGNDTISAGRGHNLISLGSGNDLVLSTGYDTIYAGSGHETIDAGAAAKHAGAGLLNFVGSDLAGSPTVFGGRGSDTFYGGAGHDQDHGGAAGHGNDLFVFTNGQAGGTVLIQGFDSGQDKVDLEGYGKDAVKNALGTQKIVGNTDTITLSDHTQISFADVNHLTASDFLINGAGGGPGNGDDDGKAGGHDDGHEGQGHGKQGMTDMDNHGHVDNSIIGHF